MDEIATRLVKKIKWAEANPGLATQADFDEMGIFFSRSSNEFPAEFRKIFQELKYTGSDFATKDQMQRLSRVLEVIESLPEHRRDAASHEVDEGALYPIFEVSKESKARIFQLCTDMRKIVLASTDFDQPHKLRLLNRIAAIEAETHKQKGMFDVVLGGVSDLGETLGKFGKDIKPLTDRMQEIRRIARKGTKEYDQLPAPEEVRQLPPPASEE